MVEVSLVFIKEVKKLHFVYLFEGIYYNETKIFKVIFFATLRESFSLLGLDDATFSTDEIQDPMFLTQNEMGEKELGHRDDVTREDTADVIHLSHLHS